MKNPLARSAGASVEALAPNWALLGGLRFGLASIVVGCHATYVLGAHRPFLDLALSLGSFAAVIAFFMVSGFSIRASIERDARGFYARRFHRIAPVYYACLALGLLLVIFAGTIIAADGTRYEVPSRRTLVSSLLLLSNVTGGLFAPLTPACRSRPSASTTAWRPCSCACLRAPCWPWPPRPLRTTPPARTPTHP